MRKSMIAVLALLLFAAAAHAGETRKISVTGRGSIEVEPDIAEVDMGILVFDEDLLTAKMKADSIISSMVNTYSSMGIGQADIRTTRLYVKPEYKLVDKDWKFMGYELTRSVTVTLKEINKINKLINRSIKAGANRLESISMKTSRMDELKKKTLDMAIMDARDKAEHLADGFGAKVGKVLDIHKGGYDRFSTVAYSISVKTNYREPASFQPGLIEIENEVDADFELTD